MRIRSDGGSISEAPALHFVAWIEGQRDGIHPSEIAGDNVFNLS
jgi:hypothetical protein